MSEEEHVENGNSAWKRLTNFGASSESRRFSFSFSSRNWNFEEGNVIKLVDEISVIGVKSGQASCISAFWRSWCVFETGDEKGAKSMGVRVSCPSGFVFWHVFEPYGEGRGSNKLVKETGFRTMVVSGEGVRSNQILAAASGDNGWPVSTSG